MSEFSYAEGSNEKFGKLFYGKSFKQINDFLENLPVKNTDEVIQKLIYEILSSNKSFDRNFINLEQDKMIFKTLINKLFDTGRLNEIELIYSLTNQLENSSFILMKMIEGNLLRNRHGEACKIVQKVNQDPELFGKIMIICNIINSKYDEAKLGLQLLKEQNQPGDIFFIDLAFSLMSENDITDSDDLKKNLDKIKQLNPIIMSSLQFADISPNFEQIENLTTSGLLFILSNPSVDTELKIYCSEILVKQGRISVEMLSEAYQLARFDKKELENAEKLYKSLSPIRARPLLYQSIIRDNKPESKYRKIISLLEISVNDDLFSIASRLVFDVVDFKSYIGNQKEAILISKMYQSKGDFITSREILSEFLKTKESYIRKLAIDISELIENGNLNNALMEENLKYIADNKSDSINLEKIIMVLIQNINLNQTYLDDLFKISINENIKSSDVQNLFLANKLSQEADYFNSLSLIFNIIQNKNFLQLNLIQSYSILIILKNLGMNEEFKELSSRILL
ncbi:MAG: hypothetical protein ACJ0G4_02645 [Alphaproteobacteria bacterium]